MTLIVVEVGQISQAHRRIGMLRSAGFFCYLQRLPGSPYAFLEHVFTPEMSSPAFQLLPEARLGIRGSIGKDY
jgi:hypothetical protein